jgi:hypothetical protein
LALVLSHEQECSSRAHGDVEHLSDDEDGERRRCSLELGSEQAEQWFVEEDEQGSQGDRPKEPDPSGLRNESLDSREIAGRERPCDLRSD